jgi:hypothetical protein
LSEPGNDKCHGGWAIRQACAHAFYPLNAKLTLRNRRATQYFSRDSHNRTSPEFASPLYFNRVNAAKIEREIVLAERRFL